MRLNPKHHARFLEAEFVYEAGENAPNIGMEILAIDLGVNNFAACISTVGTSFLIDGKRLKAENQGYNKESARLQCAKDL